MRISALLFSHNSGLVWAAALASPPGTQEAPPGEQRAPAGPCQPFSRAPLPGEEAEEGWVAEEILANGSLTWRRPVMSITGVQGTGAKSTSQSREPVEIGRAHV